MDIGVTISAVLVALGALALALLVRETDLPKPAPVPPTAHLEQRKRTLYDNLRDLQFEYRLGKLSDADYQEAKKVLQQELAQLNAKLAEQGAAPPAAVKPAVSASARPAPAESAASTVCPHCGARFAQALKFCGECGRPMAGGNA